MAKILIIDDERAIRNTMKEILTFEQYEVDVAENAKSGLEKIRENNYNLVFLDIKMSEISGEQCLETIVDEGFDVPVVMISGHGNIEVAVNCMKRGAFDFIEKPIDLNKLLNVAKNVLDSGETQISEKKIGKSKPKSNNSEGSQMIGESAIVQKIRMLIERIAPTDARVLITGKNGTGKEVVARLIYENSLRAKEPFIEVNCAAIPSELIESELFGHEKGSFTSAVKNRTGKFEEANNGTIFLDEIGDMSLSAQAKVLRCLQESEITPVGSNKAVKINVRVLAATNKDLKEEITNGNFREDLYHRLNVINIHVPSLADRKDDIPLLTEHFIHIICQEQNINNKIFTQSAINELQKLEWRGNIRELRNIVERLLILCDTEITGEDVINNV
ncbi:MAG: sigma-54 dependent transcriptional regulator [Prevotellaceae bacterium]|jgi:DNA-binding NtrC family response regulator|nr:sigma-54 dependent transcriptional regulator [Prevotellaceae bacterium]